MFRHHSSSSTHASCQSHEASINQSKKKLFSVFPDVHVQFFVMFLDAGAPPQPSVTIWFWILHQDVTVVSWASPMNSRRGRPARLDPLKLNTWENYSISYRYKPLPFTAKTAQLICSNLPQQITLYTSPLFFCSHKLNATPQNCWYDTNHTIYTRTKIIAPSYKKKSIQKNAPHKRLYPHTKKKCHPDKKFLL